MLTKYDYEKLAEDISDNFVEKDIPLNKSIKIVSVKLDLNPEQIKRLSESSNIKAYNKVYDNTEDKDFKFELADSKKIIDEVYSDSENDDSTEVEIKDLPPVQYSASKDPKNPEIVDEVLGDDDEIVVSKNTSTNEDSASDDYSDALKVPLKDYAYEDEGEEETIEELMDEDVDIVDKEVNEEDAEELRKQAYHEESPAIIKELERREMLLCDELLDSIKKTASLFKGPDKELKFAEMIKHAAKRVDDTDSLLSVLDLVRGECGIDVSASVPSYTPKYASEDYYGKSQIESLVATFSKYAEATSAREYLASESE